MRSWKASSGMGEELMGRLIVFSAVLTVAALAGLLAHARTGAFSSTEALAGSSRTIAPFAQNQSVVNGFSETPDASKSPATLRSQPRVRVAGWDDGAGGYGGR